MSKIIIGIDEAGRGCWAGPLVAAAVALAEPIEGLTDSKLLTKRKRHALELLIKDQALAYGVGFVSAADVDELGLTAATSMAMRLAVDQLGLVDADIIIDGNLNYLPDRPRVKTLIKADKLIPEVSAASILAKVARDNYMAEASSRFPEYLFEKHVGYGTALHLEKLRLHGPCELHRLSYKPVKNLLIVKT